MVLNRGSGKSSMNGGSDRKITYLNGGFFIATFDYRRIPSNSNLNGETLMIHCLMSCGVPAFEATEEHVDPR